MSKSVKKNVITIFFCFLFLFCGLICFRIDGAIAEPIVGKGENGKNITLTVDGETKQAKFKYWNYVDVKKIKTNEVLTMAMTPKDLAVAEASAVAVTLTDVVDKNQVLSAVLCTGNKWYESASTYGHVAFYDKFSIDGYRGWTNLTGTDQGVVGNDEVVPYSYSTYGALGICGWSSLAKGSDTGFFRGLEGEGHFGICPITFKYDGKKVQTVAHKSYELTRTIADLTNKDFLSKSTSSLREEGFQKELKQRYTSEYVASLFGSGYVEIEITFYNCVSDEISFELSTIAGEIITEEKDTSAPIVNFELTTGAIIGQEYTLPEISLYENSEDDAICSLTVLSPEGNEVQVNGGKFYVAQEGEYTLNYTCSDGKGNEKTYVYAVPAYASMPKVSFVKTSQEEFMTECNAYGKIIVPAYKAVSKLSTVKDGELKVYALILLNGSIFKKVDDVTVDNYVTLTQSGEGKIVYVAVNEYNQSVASEYFDFEVYDQAFIELSENEYDAVWGQEFVIPSKYCIYRGNKYKAHYTVMDPQGNAVSADKKGKIVLKNQGDYTINYSYEIDGQSATGVYTVHSQLKASQLFTVSSKVTNIVDGYQFPAYAKEQNESGLFLASSEDNNIVYNNIIDLNRLSKDVPLISLLPYADIDSGKFKLTITLQDVENPAEKVIIVAQPHSEMWQYSYVNVNFDGRTLAFNTETNAINSSAWYGCLCNIPMGTAYGHSNIQQFTLWMDYQNKDIFTRTALGRDPWLLLDMDNTDHVGAGKQWKGFTSGRVKLSIYINEIKKNNAGVIITNIAGQSLTGNRVIDETAPILYYGESDYFKVEEDTKYLPEAEKNKPYKIVAVNAYDTVDGVVEVNYSLKKQGSEEELFNGFEYVFAEDGKYVYEVKARDIAGNETVRSFFINVLNEVPKINIELGTYETSDTYVLKTFTLPEIIVYGGSGNIVYSVEYSFNGKAIVSDKLNRVYLPETGDLLIKVKANDYLGTAIETDSSFTIPVKSNGDIVLEHGGEPRAFVVGQVNVVENFKALVYSDDQVVECKYKAIKIGGEIIYSVENGVETGSLKYEIDEKTADFVTFEYLAGESASNIVATERYQIPLIEIEYVSDLIIPFEYDETCVGHGITEVYRDGFGSKFDIDGNLGLQVINPLIADGLVVRFSGTKDVNQVITLRFTDSINDEISFSIKLYKENGNFYMILNPTLENRIPGRVSGSFSNIEGYFYFEYDEDEKRLVDSSGRTVMYVTDCDNGLAFEGFTSGTCFVKIEIEATEACDINILQIGDQVFTALDNETTYSDFLGPRIFVNGKVPITTMTVGQKILIPTAIASDVCTGKAAVSVTVTIDGMPLAGYQNLPTDKTYELTFAEYGIYNVVYTSYDLNNKRSFINFVLRVDDMEKPEIVVNGEIKTHYNFGEKLERIDFVATDNCSSQENITVYAFLEMPSGAIVDVKGVAGFELKYKGKYNLILCALDESSNYAFITYEIIVE